MTLLHFVRQSLVFYRRTHAAVAGGVATAVAVLAGSLLVGDSVRASLTTLATSRLGRTDVVITAERPFTQAFGARLQGSGIERSVSLLALQGLLRHQGSERRAGRVSVYGVDAAFFAFHGSGGMPPADEDVLLSPALAAELAPATGDTILLRVARPTDIPADSLHGRRDEVGRALRLRHAGTLAASAMGEFSLSPAQGPVRAAFVNLARMQRGLELDARVNTVLLSAAAGSDLAGIRTAASRAIRLGDLGVTTITLPDRQTVIVESSSGLIPHPIASAIEASAARAAIDTASMLTWLANSITIDGREVPYSIVTAVPRDGAGDAAIARWLTPVPNAPPPIVLTAWAAEDLRARPGDDVELEFYRWAEDGRLVTDRAAFRLAGIAPMTGFAIDRRMAPDYPGITASSRFSDWDPPFPIDLTRVRPRDEAFWERYRTAPKAFVPLDVGQRLWRSRHGQLTSIRLHLKEPLAEAGSSASLSQVFGETERDVSPFAVGFNVVDVRRQNVRASAGATDFGAYFAYFSFFLMVAALLLSALFFRLSLEARHAQIGVLRAAGYPSTVVRRVLAIEGIAVASAGAVLGAALAIGWAALMMTGLRTWWVGAVGTTLLELHVEWRSLAIGIVGGVLSAIVAIVLTVRTASRSTPRALMTGMAADVASAGAGWVRVVAGSALALAIALSVLAGLGMVSGAAGFFGAGSLVLVAGLAAFGSWLRSRGSSAGKPVSSLARLGLANAAWRPGRSLTSAGLVAAAVFLLVSVDAFRKRVDATGGPTPATGGFALIAESEVPIVFDLSQPQGRAELGLEATAGDPTMEDVAITSLRLRPGDDTSCLNLYQPARPRVVGVPDRMIQAAPFRFATSVAATDEDRANPWRLLAGSPGEGVPAIVDATSLQYVLHAAVGDVITIDADTARPIRVRIVASLDDSVLQGEILIGERAFRELFPQIAGYRAFLVAAPGAGPDRVDAITRTLEDRLADFGFDAEDTTRRLEAFHRVENTYLSTFQALGGLGLALGCLGLIAVVARNVLERRRELALLGAAGFSGRGLQAVVAAEHLGLVSVGVGVGVVAALVAVAPVVIERGGVLPWSALAWIVPVIVAGAAAVWVATRQVSRLPLVPSLRRE
jgi:ABC-type antimicrobial peptide transport system permease subunit